PRGGQDGLAPLGDAPVGGRVPLGDRAPVGPAAGPGPLGHRSPSPVGVPKSPTSWTSVRRVTPSSSRARPMARRMGASTSGGRARGGGRMKLVGVYVLLSPPG